jgi:hypothetical protein
MVSTIKQAGGVCIADPFAETFGGGGTAIAKLNGPAFSGGSRAEDQGRNVAGASY